MDAQLKSLDAITGRLLARLEKASGGSLSLALSADHGATPRPRTPRARPSACAASNGKSSVLRSRSALQAQWPLKDATWILSNQIPHLYLNRREAEALGFEWSNFLNKAAKLLSGIAGLAAVYVPGEKDAPFAEQTRRSYDPGRSGDLLAIMGRNVLLGDAAPGHEPRHAVGLRRARSARLMGPRCAPGVDAPAATVDLAPTLGRLLGIDYPPGDGASGAHRGVGGPALKNEYAGAQAGWVLEQLHWK